MFLVFLAIIALAVPVSIIVREKLECRRHAKEQAKQSEQAEEALARQRYFDSLGIHLSKAKKS
jgi:hypothetical protein